MTVLEFHKNFCRSALKVMSGYNDKVLCRAFDPKKHPHISEREIIAVWADIIVTDAGFGNYAKPILCAYVNGAEEYIKEHREEVNER